MFTHAFRATRHFVRSRPARATAIVLGVGAGSFSAHALTRSSLEAPPPARHLPAPVAFSSAAASLGETVELGAFRLFQPIEEGEAAAEAIVEAVGEAVEGSTAETEKAEEAEEAEEEQSRDEGSPAEEGQSMEEAEANEVEAKEAADSAAEVAEAAGGDDAIKTTLEAAEPHIRRLLARDFIELKKHFEEEMEAALAKKDSAHKEELDAIKQRAEEEAEARIKEQVDKLRAGFKQEYDGRAGAYVAELNKKWQEARENLIFEFSQELHEKKMELLQESKKTIKQRMHLLSEINQDIRSVEDQLSQSEAQAQKDLRSQRLCLALFSLLNSSMQSGHPLAKDIERVLKESGEHETIHVALKSIPRDVAERGVPTRQELCQRFASVKKIGRREAFVPEGGGLFAQAFAAVLAAVTIPETGLVSGSDPDAIFARAQYFLDRGDLKEAIDELSHLRGLAAVVTCDFVQAAKERLMVEESINVVRDYVAANVAASD
eukprot:TRINITY_DN134_c1_g2_i1.p1 TRINITY_DN134_c1_g2~~TRINITY_DN134_c1_g2_i1.p1  ORF type:complete len:490 (-),score=194.39 TRINITY_DN134_c1_g2_i1:278-1747(-)